MFPVDCMGRISFIAEDSSARFTGGRQEAMGQPKQLVVMGKPAASGSKPPTNLYEMKKRLMQMSSPLPHQEARQQRASLDRLPGVRNGPGSGQRELAPPISASSLSSTSIFSSASQAASSPIAQRDEKPRGKSLSPPPLHAAGMGGGNSDKAASLLELRRKDKPPPLKPLSFPPDPMGGDKRSQEPATLPPKAAADASERLRPKPPPAKPPLQSSGQQVQKLQQESVDCGDLSPVKNNRVVPLTKSYKYRFLPGNNGRVILQAFRRRPWWHAMSVEKSVDPASETEIVEYDFLWEMYRTAKRYKGDSFKECCLNHIQYNHSLVTKKGLYFTLRNYCAAKSLDILDVVPRTFYLHAAGRDDSHIGEGKTDDMESFLEYNRQMENSASQSKIASKLKTISNIDAVGEGGEGGGKCEGPVKTVAADGRLSPSEDETGVVWICKPASLTNRGFGITVLRGVEEVLALTKRAQSSDSTGLEQARAEGTKPSTGALGKAARRRGAQEGWIVQEYMERPLLVSGRKFDIRCFVLLVMQKGKNVEAKLKAYFYEDAYVRTSCKRYTMDKLSDRECHLTNDAVQKHAKGYGKFESGNKLTMEEWQLSLEKDYSDAPPNVVFSKILPEIKRLSSISVAAAVSAAKLGKTDISRSFELLGYDYMIDSNYQPRLIEINSNPCLEFACPLLKQLITALIDNTFKTAVDFLCPPPPAGKRTRLCEEVCNAIDNEPDKFEELRIDDFR